MSQKHLTTTQYNKICKYWRQIEKIQLKIKEFDYSRIKDSILDWNSSDTDDEEEEEEEEDEATKELCQLIHNVYYLEREYETYITKIGFELNDRSYDEGLFNILNNGIETPELVLVEPVMIFK
jgi:hypothetical protein